MSMALRRETYRRRGEPEGGRLFKWSGGASTEVGLFTRRWADDINQNTVGAGGDPSSYPMPATVVRQLRVNVVVNLWTGAAGTVGIFRGGVITPLAVTVPPGFTGILTNLVTLVFFNNNDTIDFGFTRVAAIAGEFFYCSSTVLV